MSVSRPPARIPVPENEDEPLQALAALDVIDTPCEQAFDDLVWLASQLCGTPIALVSLVDAERQWFKARCGLDVEETPRAHAFCAHALGLTDILEVPDARADPRFADNPLVTGAPGIRFYAGAPLVGRTGHCYGTLCVIDTRPRRLEPQQREGLSRLARRTVASLESRQQQLRSEAREQTLVHLLDAMPNGVVTCGPDGLLAEFNRTARDWYGVEPGALPPEEWAEYFDLFEPDGEQPLTTDRIPLLRAWGGERVREAEIVVRAQGQAPRRILCNAEPFHSAEGRLLGAVCVMHDVTRLKAAQDAAQVEAQRFAAAFSSAAQGMALVSLEGRWLEVNDALCDILGYGREELLALDFQRLTHPEDLGLGLEHVAALLAGRERSFQMQKRYFHRSGRIVHAHLSVSLVRDTHGRPLHFVSQIKDATQRVLAEQRLRESEARFRSVLENSLDAFVAMDEAGLIVEWNRAASVTFGWPRSEVLGKPLGEIIVPPRLRGAHAAGLARYLSSGEARVLDQRLQLPAWHRGGHEFPVEMTITMVRLGDRRVFNAFLHDISQRAAADARLRDSELQLRMVADNVPALIGHVDAGLRYRFVNQPYADWFGLDRAALVGRHMGEILRPEHFAAIQPQLERVLAGETVVFDMDVVARDGGLRHMHATYIPDRDGVSGPRGFHLMVHDLTPQTWLARMLEERAMTDALTGLPNRAAWSEELARGLARANRAGTPAAVMFLDLDGFKQVNDSHGHAAGDAMLCEFADRLRATLRRSDFIARLAGDEFVVLLDRVTDLGGDPPLVAEKILEAMAAPFDVAGQRLHMTPSIGLAVQNGPDFDAACLMRRADAAMYRAKRSDRCKYALLEC